MVREGPPRIGGRGGPSQAGSIASRWGARPVGVPEGSRAAVVLHRPRRPTISRPVVDGWAGLAELLRGNGRAATGRARLRNLPRSRALCHYHPMRAASILCARVM